MYIYVKIILFRGIMAQSLQIIIMPNKCEVLRNFFLYQIITIFLFIIIDRMMCKEEYKVKCCCRCQRCKSIETVHTKYTYIIEGEMY